MIPRTCVPSPFPNDHRVRKLSRLLGTSKAAAFGHLIALWCYQSAALDGRDFVGMDPEDLAEAALYDGNGSDLAGALIESLLAEKLDGGGIRLVLWWTENQSYIEKRNYDIERKRRERTGQKGSKGPKQEGNESGAAAAAPADALSVYPSVQPSISNPPRASARTARSSRTAKDLEAQELLHLGSHRSDPGPASPAEDMTSVEYFSKYYRTAAEKARAAGELEQAQVLEAKAAEMEARVAGLGTA